MEIAQVNTKADLFRLFQLQDTNGDQFLGMGEVSVAEIAQYDVDGDQRVSPWEVMEGRAREIGGLLSYGTSRSKEAGSAVVDRTDRVLAEDTEIDGVRYRRGTRIEFDSNGRVMHGTLVEGAMCLNGIAFTEVLLNSEGYPVGGRLPADITIGGIGFSAGTEISFYPQGGVYRGTLLTDITINGIRYRGGSEIRLTASGQVEVGVLASPITCYGITFGPGTQVEYFGGPGQNLMPDVATFLVPIRIAGRLYSSVEFRGSADIRAGVLAEDTMINGINYRGRLEYGLFGHVQRGFIVSDITIDGITLRSGTYITLSGLTDRIIESGVLAETITRYGRTFIEGTSVFFARGRFEGGVLLADTEIDGVMFRADSSIRFYANGQVYFGQLAADTTISGVVYRAGMELQFFDNGQVEEVACIPRVREGNNIMVRGTGYQLPVSFFANGQLRTGYLSMNLTVDDVTYSSGRYIEFYPNGRVARGILAADIIHDGITFGRESEISFDEQGRLIIGELSVDTTLGVIRYRGGDRIEFYANGQVSFGSLAEDINRYGRTFRAGTLVGFDERGRLIRGALSADTTIRGIRYGADDFLSFFPDGRVRGGTLARDTVIGGMGFEVGTEVFFDTRGRLSSVNLRMWGTMLIQGIVFSNIFWRNPIDFYTNGRVQRGLLAQDTIIRGQIYLGGTVIEFHSNGQVFSGTLVTGERIVLDIEGNVLQEPGQP